MNFRNRSSAFVATREGAHILIDTTPDLRIQALQFKLRRIDAVLFTHAHADHIFGLDDVRGFNFPTGQRIPCYGTIETLAEIRKRFSYIFEREGSYEGGALPKLDLLNLEYGNKFIAAGTEILPLLVHHGHTAVTAYRIGPFGYVTDCNFIPSESRELLKGVEVLVLDGLRYEAHLTHFTIPEAIEVAHELGARKTFLTHMTHTVDYHSVSAELPPDVFLAFDGLEITC